MPSLALHCMALYWTAHNSCDDLFFMYVKRNKRKVGVSDDFLFLLKRDFKLTNIYIA